MFESGIVSPATETPSVALARGNTSLVNRDFFNPSEYKLFISLATRISCLTGLAQPLNLRYLEVLGSYKPEQHQYRRTVKQLRGINCYA